MTPNVQIVPSTLEHVRELALTLREKDKEEALALGLEPQHGLFMAFKKACYCKTALVDGKVAAMWGLHGVLLGQVGYPYFVTGTLVEKVSPIRFARLYKEETEEMRKLFPVLENYVDATYEGAIRMLRVAGFELSEPFKLPNGKEFRRFTMRTE